MRPILAIIPALPQTFLIPTLVIAFLAGALAAFKIKSATPLAFVGGVAFLAYLWSRQSITLHSYGLFLVLGFFLSTYLACFEAKRRGFDPNVILDAAMPLLLVSILLCRVLYFLIYPSQWQGFGQFLQIWNGGLSFHGAIIGALGTLAYFSYARKIPFGTLCDSISPGMFLGYGVGRIGCFMNGCCYGHPTDLTLGGIIGNVIPSLGHAIHIPLGVVFPDETNRLISTPPSHPAQLYSTILSLFIFAFMWRARTKPAFNRFPGQMAMLLLAFIAVERFIIEFFRKGATAPLAFGLDWLTKAQLASVLGILVLAALYAVLSRRPHTQNALQTASSNHVSAG